ncbi:MAG: hypothetical protein IPM23_27150 [Candidatus Melainabacteria bacterium]|nr:hypothetical protein [Candidatus Melainabacteria bacterium]
MSRPPLRLEVVTNFIAETIMQVKETLGPRLSDFEIDWVNYFAGCGQDLNMLEKNGVDVSQDRLEFMEALWAQPRRVRTRVSKLLSFSDPLLKTKYESMLTALESVFLDSSIAPPAPMPQTVRGDEAGFNSILEAARKLPQLGRAVEPVASQG